MKNNSTIPLKDNRVKEKKARWIGDWTGFGGDPNNPFPLKVPPTSPKTPEEKIEKLKWLQDNGDVCVDDIFALFTKINELVDYLNTHDK